jgi:thiamine-monophosphate kinase
MAGEFAAIERIAGLLPDGPAWIGDDAAVLPDGLLFAADAVVAGVHADLSLTTLDDLGWKALVSNVSDIAAMGGEPSYAVVTVAGPADIDLDALYRGLAAASVAYGCPVVGGDLTNAPALVVTVAILGTVDGPPVLRSGAGAGDRIWVTGPLGAAAHGLAELRAGTGPGDAHRRPHARVAEGRRARLAGATAMIDVSDGLGADLCHVLEASGVGCALDTVPLAPGATLEDALGGGEDYELVFMMPAATAVDWAIAIGACTDDPTERTLQGAPLPPAGWQHDWK